MNELALFAGAGGGILAGVLLGWRTVCAVELDAYAAGVLVARQNEGSLAPFPIWDDVRTFDGRPWRGRVDVVSGGFPCQDISAAGSRAGIDGKRSGLWREMARVIGEVMPRHVFIENSPLLVNRGLSVVLEDLAALGYDAEWMVLGARHVGAPHKRDRFWMVAHANGGRREELGLEEHLDEQGQLRSLTHGLRQDGWRRWSNGDWWQTEPGVGRVADGLAGRVGRLRATGNGQVPSVAAVAWSVLEGRNP